MRLALISIRRHTPCWGMGATRGRSWPARAKPMSRDPETVLMMAEITRACLKVKIIPLCNMPQYTPSCNEPHFHHPAHVRCRKN